MALTGDALARLATALLGGTGEAQEAVQESYLAAWRSIGDFRDGTDLHAWLRTLCLNACRTRLRSRRRERRAQAAADPRGSVASEAGLEIDLREALRDLPDREREAVALMVLEGLDSRAAGAAMGCSDSAARVYLGRARRVLMERLGGREP